MSVTRATTVRVLLIAAMAAAILSAATPAGAAAPRHCAPIGLTGAGQDLGADSSGNDHTTATLYVLGVAVGTTNATFTPSGPPVGPRLAFTGPIVFTPLVSHASLTAQVNGAVDVVTGVFTASSTTVSGTGFLTAVSGHVTIQGNENLTTGAFTEMVTGKLCAPISFQSTRS